MVTVMVNQKKFLLLYLAVETGSDVYARVRHATSVYARWSRLNVHIHLTLFVHLVRSLLLDVFIALALTHLSMGILFYSA